MDQVLAQAKIAILPTSKVWDGQRAYERKLGTAASKSRGLFLSSLLFCLTDGVAAKGTRGRQSKTAEVVTTEDDEPMEDVAEKPKKTAPKPRPRRAAAVRTTRARKAEVDADEEEDAEADADADADGDADPDIHLTPPATPPVRAARPRRGAKPAAAAASPPPRPDSLPPSSPLSQSSAATPRKRARPAEEEDEEDVGAAPASPALSDASQYSEVILKRKRARH
jgi:cohesin complex subunit SA-1/2